MLPSPRALAATDSSRVGAGCGPIAARKPTRPSSLRSPVRPGIRPLRRHQMRTAGPQEYEWNERYGYQSPGREDAPSRDAEAVAEAAVRAEHGSAELLAWPHEIGRRRDEKAPRRPRAREGSGTRSAPRARAAPPPPAGANHASRPARAAEPQAPAAPAARATGMVLLALSDSERDA